jgi:uncharacterized protein YecT (DUF1311 family)
MFLMLSMFAAAPAPSVPQPSKEFLQACYDRAKTQEELNFCAAGESEAKKHELQDAEAVVCFNKELSQFGMNMCSGQEFDRADKALNFAWQKAKASTNDDQATKLLLESQRTWLKFRDAQCASVADENRGGSIVPLVENECLVELTRDRTKQLIEFSTPEDQR